MTDQLIASLWASASHYSNTYTNTQIHLSYHPMGKSWIRLPLTAYPHTYTQTHPSIYYWALLEAPQILIRFDFWVGLALDKGSTLNPTLSPLGPFPHSHAQRLLSLFSPPHPCCLYMSPGPAWSLFLCLCAPGELCLNKSCLPLVLSTAVEAGGEADNKVLA